MSNQRDQGETESRETGSRPAPGAVRCAAKRRSTGSAKKVGNHVDAVQTAARCGHKGINASLVGYLANLDAKIKNQNSADQQRKDSAP